MMKMEKQNEGNVERENKIRSNLKERLSNFKLEDRLLNSLAGLVYRAEKFNYGYTNLGTHIWIDSPHVFTKVSAEGSRIFPEASSYLTKVCNSCSEYLEKDSNLILQAFRSSPDFIREYGADKGFEEWEKTIGAVYDLRKENGETRKKITESLNKDYDDALLEMRA